MNLEQMRKRIGEIRNELEKLNGCEDLTAEQVTKVDELTNEFQTVKSKIEAKERLENVMNLDMGGQRQVNPSNNAPQPVRIEVEPHATVGNGGFKSQGEFYNAVKSSVGGAVDPRFKNTAFEKSGEDGGFLIPEDFRTEIQKKVSGDESLMSRTRQFKTNSNHLVLPTNETAPWDSKGIQAYWEGEGAQHTDSKSEFGNTSMRLNKLTAYVKVSEEMLEDSIALESYIKQEAPEAMLHKINSAIINGVGSNKPQGILQCGYTLNVAKESGQAADSIVYKNLIKMEARLINSAQGVWIAHAEAKEQLRQLKDDNGNFIYLNGAQFANAAAAPFDTLLGKPIIYMMGAMPQLGDRGDIILGNMSHYITAMKSSGVKQQISTHVHFDRDLVAFKFTTRVAGQCPYKAPITTENGNYQMSGFTTIEDRA